MAYRAFYHIFNTIKLFGKEEFIVKNLKKLLAIVVCIAMMVPTVAFAATSSPAKVDVKTATAKSLTYNAMSQTTTIVVNGKTLTLNKDFTVVSGNLKATKAGTYTVKIKGIGNYSGETTVKYTVNAQQSYKATAAAKVLEKAIKREEEYKKQEELLKEGKVEEAAQVITQDEEATMAASVSEAVAARRKSLPKEAKYLYKYLGVEPDGAQIVNVLQTLKVDPKRSKNIVILGQHGFGLAMVGEDFAKFYYDMGICKSEAKAKVKAKVINSGKLAGAVSKLKGGCLIIESAGLITPERFKEMVDMCSPEKNDIKIILTGEKTALSNMLAANMSQARAFNNRVYFDQINENGMVNVAECYADEKGFKLENGADAAIKNILM